MAVTALALYRGRSLADFELVGLTTDPALIDEILAIVATYDPTLLSKAAKPKRRSALRLLPEDPTR
jgi:hypothetical protein